MSFVPPPGAPKGEPGAWYVGTHRVELSPVMRRFHELRQEYRNFVIGQETPWERGPLPGVYPEDGWQLTVAVLLLAEVIADAASTDA